MQEKISEFFKSIDADDLAGAHYSPMSALNSSSRLAI